MARARGARARVARDRVARVRGAHALLGGHPYPSPGGHLTPTPAPTPPQVGTAILGNVKIVCLLGLSSILLGELGAWSANQYLVSPPDQPEPQPEPEAEPQPEP